MNTSRIISFSFRNDQEQKKKMIQTNKTHKIENSFTYEIQKTFIRAKQIYKETFKIQNLFIIFKEIEILKV